MMVMVGIYIYIYMCVYNHTCIDGVTQAERQNSKRKHQAVGQVSSVRDIPPCPSISTKITPVIYPTKVYPDSSIEQAEQTMANLTCPARKALEG